MKKPKDSSPPVATNPEEIEELIVRIEKDELSAQDRVLVAGLLRLLMKLVWVTKAKEATVGRLRSLLFGAKTERRSEKKKDDGDGDGGSSVSDAPSLSAERKAEGSLKRTGHGRNRVDAYSGANTVVCADERLFTGARCLEACCEGRLFQDGSPIEKIVLTGQPLIGATRYEQPAFRCGRCRRRYVTALPEGVTGERHTPESDATLALARYGTGLPLNRLSALQDEFGIPLSPSVQWERSEQVANAVLPVFFALTNEAAGADLIHQDDTPMKIVSGAKSEKGRTATRTTGLVARTGTAWIALYVSGCRHAGENMAELLKRRKTKTLPLRMGDALGQNWICEDGEIGKCLAHGRRRFFDIRELYPELTRPVLDVFGAVYRVEAWAKDLPPDERMDAHQALSGPLLARLHDWITLSREARRFEPNGAFGKACAYLLRHWDGLTRFLDVPGMPLDNNACERALKPAVLHRKNSLLYRTGYGALVGDILLSVIETCRLNNVSAWSYLTAAPRAGAKTIREIVQDWLPWRWAASPG